MLIRHDDFDFRMTTQEYVDNHEKFINAGLTETAVVQLARNGRFSNFPTDLIEYMKTAPNWDIQLHGWGHDMYSEWEYDYILRDISAAVYWVEKLFERKPTIWFPPWNQMSLNMERVAKVLGLTINNESNDIAKFIRETKTGDFKGSSVYFHLWNRGEAELIDEMVELLKCK